MSVTVAASSTKERRPFWRNLPHWGFLVLTGLLILFTLPSNSATAFSTLPTPRPVLDAIGRGRDCPPPNPCGYWDGDRWHCACGGEDPPAPPSVSGALNCSSAGNAGWCVGMLTLDINVSPSDLPISGDTGADVFFCPAGVACSVPLPEGDAVAHFESSNAGGTDSGSLSYLHDSVAPAIHASLSGDPGDDGWFTSYVDVSADISDATSGVVSAEVRLDGSGWSAYTGSFTVPDGMHEAAFRASDAAGNQTETGTQSFKVDAISPYLDVSLTGASGTNGWYRSPVAYQATVSDDGSGPLEPEYSLDGGAWTSASGTISGDGPHTLSVRGFDAAGNESDFDGTILVDTVTPVILILPAGTPGSNGWYVSEITVTASASDATSGLSSFEYSYNGGAWTPYIDPLEYTDGVQTLRFRAVDNAGNSTVTPARNYYVDTRRPLIELPESWNLGDTVHYKITETQSGLAGVRLVIKDDQERFPKLHWYGEAEDVIPWDGRFADGNRAPDGQYEAWVTATDRAGNQAQKMGTITVENNLFNFFLPAFNPPTEDPLAQGGAESVAGGGEQTESAFGGQAGTDELIPETGSARAGGLTAVHGTAGVAVNFSSPEPDEPLSLPEASGILWGAAAAAAIAAYAAEVERQKAAIAAAQEEAFQKMAKRSGERANPMTYGEIAKAFQASLDNVRRGLAENHVDADVINQIVSAANAAGKIPSIQIVPGQPTLNSTAKGDDPKPLAVIVDGAALSPTTGNAISLTTAVNPSLNNILAQNGASPAENPFAGAVDIGGNWSGLGGALGSGKSDSNKAESAGSSWLAGIPIVGSQLDAWWEESLAPAIDQSLNGLQIIWEEKIYEPVVSSPLFKPVATALSIAALIGVPAYGIDLIQQTVAANPGLFSDANQNAIDQLRYFFDQHPEFINHPADADFFEYFRENPGEALGAASDMVKGLLTALAGYGDAAWQENPVVQILAPILRDVGDAACAQVSDQAWGNRCFGAAYLAASLLEQPYDTAAGVINSWVVDPLTGLGKLYVFAQENNLNTIVFNAVQAAQTGGWEAVQEYGLALGSEVWNELVVDPQVQSAVFLMALIGLAFIPVLGLPAAGGIAAGMTIKGLIDLDAILAQLPTKESVIEFASSHQVRTTVISSILVFMLLAFGAEKAAKFDAFRNGLSPEAQAEFSKLSIFEQSRIAETAIQMKLQPGATEFYLDLIQKGDTRLSNLPLDQALRISSMAEQTGKGAVLLDFVETNATNPAGIKALLDSSPQALNRYLDLMTRPDTPRLGDLPAQDALGILNGQVVRVDPAIAVNLAAELVRATGKDAWGSAFTGQVYFAETTPRGWAAGTQLIELIRQSPDQVNSPEAMALMQIISEEAWRGNKNGLQLGPFQLRDPTTGDLVIEAGVQRGIYIQDALNNGRGFFDMGDVYYSLEKALENVDLKPDQELWPINEGVLQSAFESKAPIEVVYTDINAELTKWEAFGNNEVPIRIRELRWIVDHASEFGYIREGNRWIWQP